ncbi:Transcriptional regulator, TetR family [Marinobacterium lacunae]|uniref:Transcriptional regulator, TetR family n=1 Tax=Marinobacterium lacunae TaxID=1232683 RepID=A0A081FX02_9GAMM|nr:TetR/AcrR family transcriptional regulator [Marinobacterium lacunae]KEA63057.1 Transcriptional regulator, TetR family [Marinobacterium lacunae]
MKKNDNYHHGNLRQALIDAAFDVVVELGRDAVSLRELANTLNVSRGAPYRHFPDKDSLLAAVASKGFILMSETLEPLESRLGTDLSVTEIGKAFLEFAEGNPLLFQVMFDPGLMSQAVPDSEFGEALEAVYNRVSALVKSRLQIEDEMQLKQQMVAMWSTLYGYAHLRHAEMLKPYMVAGVAKDEIEKAVLTTAFSWTGKSRIENCV